MVIKQAVVIRFKELCKTKNIKYGALATISGVSRSSVYSMLNESRNDIGMVLLKKLCDGLEISITEFFNDDLFRNLEQEIY